MNKIISISILSLMTLSVIGCGSVQMAKYTFDGKGNLISVSTIKHSRIGSGKLTGVNVDLDKGTVEMAKYSGDSGKLGELLSNAGKLMIQTSKVIAAGTVGGVIVK